VNFSLFIRFLASPFCFFIWFLCFFFQKWGKRLLFALWFHVLPPSVRTIRKSAIFEGPRMFISLSKLSFAN
jgi:hypothetical protein